MRDFSIDIERPQPGSGTVLVPCDVHQRVGVERGQEVYWEVLLRQSFERLPRWLEPPDVHLSSGLGTLDEVDPLTIGRPHRVVIVETWVRMHKDLARGGASAIGQEQRVTAVERGRCVDAPFFIWRPRGRRKSGRKERPRCASPERDEKLQCGGVTAGTEPDFRAIS